jgi:lycopene beta-cyclase
LAAACADLGLAVAVVDPAPAAPFPATYGLWSDEAEALGLDEAVAIRWSDTWARGTDLHRLSRGYVRLDNARLAERFARASVRRLKGSVWSDGASVVVHGASVRAPVVVDCTGTGSVIGRAPASAMQWAWGARVSWPGHPWPADQMGLMDLTEGPLGGSPPSFLYVMPEGPDAVFVEETVLATRAPIAFDALRTRLDARLRSLGWTGELPREGERVRIPMDASPPAPRGAVVAFGASAGLVHPATGYHLAAALRAAPRVAQALTENLGRGPQVAAGAAWRALGGMPWRVTRSLHLRGLDVLLSLSGAEQRLFFDAFFRLPRPQWEAYLRADAPPTQVAQAMARLFTSGGGDLRRLVLRGAARGLLGGAALPVTSSDPALGDRTLGGSS